LKCAQRKAYKFLTLPKFLGDLGLYYLNFFNYSPQLVTE
jgi:hypothetical protein